MTSEEPLEVAAERRRARRVASKVALILVGIAAVVATVYYYAVWIPRKNRFLDQHALKILGLLYLNYENTHKKSPTDLGDLVGFAREEERGNNSPDEYDAPRAFAMIREGRFVVIWDAEIPRDRKKAQEYVLGYEAHALQKGGLVLFADGGVRHVTAEEFQTLAQIETGAD